LRRFRSSSKAAFIASGTDIVNFSAMAAQSAPWPPTFL
jgi:hypothetical protein